MLKKFQRRKQLFLRVCIYPRGNRGREGVKIKFNLHPFSREYPSLINEIKSNCASKFTENPFVSRSQRETRSHSFPSPTLRVFSRENTIFHPPPPPSRRWHLVASLWLGMNKHHIQGAFVAIQNALSLRVVQSSPSK